MEFKDKRMTYENTRVDIMHYGFNGDLSTLISKEEFDSMTEQEFKKKLFDIAKKSKNKIRVYVEES